MPGLRIPPCDWRGSKLGPPCGPTMRKPCASTSMYGPCWSANDQARVRFSSTIRCQRAVLDRALHCCAHSVQHTSCLRHPLLMAGFAALFCSAKGAALFGAFSRPNQRFSGPISPLHWEIASPLQWENTPTAVGKWRLQLHYLIGKPASFG